MWKYKWKLAQTTGFAKPARLTRANHEPRTAWFDYFILDAPHEVPWLLQ